MTFSRTPFMMLRIFLFLLIWGMFGGHSLLLMAQVEHPASSKSAFNSHLQQRENNPPATKPGPTKHLKYANQSSVNYDSLYQHEHNKHVTPRDCGLGDNIVYGYNPYWMGSAWKSYNFKLLSHVAYWGYQVNLSTGGPKNVWEWETTGLVDAAKKEGCKVHLVVTTLGSGGPSRDLLNNASAVENCTKTLAKSVYERGADGVCIDFEDMRAQDTTAFVSFVRKLRKELRKLNPNAEIAIACYALNGHKYFNLPELNKLVDYMVIMGYDYSWKGAKTAGAVAPLPGNFWKYLNLELSIDDYLNNGIDKEHLVLALPYYGYEWVTKGNSFVTNDVVSYKATLTFRQFKSEIEPYYTRYWDTNSSSSFFTKKSDGQYLQAWIPDSMAMAEKFDLVLKKKIAGTGMWALGYDNGYHYMWNLIHEKFHECKVSLKPSEVRTTAKELLDSGDKGVVDAASPDAKWHKKYRWILFWIIGGAFIAFIGFLVVDRKAREEILNRYMIYPLISLFGLVTVVMVYEMLRPMLEKWLSDSFPWYVLFGILLVGLGFLIGVKWEQKKQKEP